MAYVQCSIQTSSLVVPILVAIPLIFGLIIFGEFRLYLWIAQPFGGLAGIGGVSATVILAGVAIMASVRSYQRIHGKTVDRMRILKLSGRWGVLTLDANGKQGNLTLEGKTASFIFADIKDVRMRVIDDHSVLCLQLAHAAQDIWPIPMKDAAQSRRWHKILHYAAEQRL